MSADPGGGGQPVGVTMRRSLMHLPETPAVAAPLRVRRATVEDSGDLAALLGRSYPTERWDAEGTAKELFRDESVHATLVVTDEERIVATASLQVQQDDPERGQLRWVGTERDWQRKGLARSLIIGVLDTARQTGCREVFLRTTSDLVGAISLYLQLDFEPQMPGAHDQQTWDRLFAAMHHSDQNRLN